MQKAGFSSLKAHQQSHEFLMRKVAVLRGKFNAGRNVSMLLLSMLKGWLANHIKDEDRDYIDSVKKSPAKSGGNKESGNFMQFKKTFQLIKLRRGSIEHCPGSSNS